MPYTTPVTDRTQSDVINKTSKGLFNVADWTRIYGNEQYIYSLLGTIGLFPAFTSIATPTITTIPSVTDLDNLIYNIELMRLALVNVGINISGLSALDYGWVAGIQEDAPDYTDANTWEQSIDLIYSFFNGNQPRHAITGKASTGQGLTRQHSFRRY